MTSPTRRTRRPRAAARLVAALVATAALGALALPGVSAGDLQSQLDAAQQHAQELRGAVHTQTLKIEGLQGRLDDLQTRLDATEESLDFEQHQLDTVQTRLRAARARLVRLQRHLHRDRDALAAQLRAAYESAPPDAVSIIMSATDFADLLQRVHDLKRVEQYTVKTVTRIKGERQQVSAQTARLTRLEARRRRLVTAARIQRNMVARLHTAVARRQQHAIAARDRTSDALDEAQDRGRALQHKIDEQAAAAAKALGAPPASGTPFQAHGGSYGFFQAAGTNYSVGDEPEIAARLDRMGKALHLHLIGISGYRTPEHSVAVGGFPNDPHTRGEASDTPGVEGVPEATLNQYGLTRPFGGAAEADHIQLLGSL